MKLNIRILAGAGAIIAAASLNPIAFGQTAVSESTTTTTSADGTVSEFTPGGDTVVLRSETSSEPIRYSYSKSTTVVDDAGNPVDMSIVKTGVPVQVFYDRDGDRMVARRIVVRHVRHHDADAAPAAVVHERAESTTTTTTHEK